MFTTLHTIEGRPAALPGCSRFSVTKNMVLVLGDDFTISGKYADQTVSDHCHARVSLLNNHYSGTALHGSYLNGTIKVGWPDSSAFASASRTIDCISSSESPEDALMTIDCSFPVALSFALTFKLPFESYSEARSHFHKDSTDKKLTYFLNPLFIRKKRQFF